MPLQQIAKVLKSNGTDGGLLVGFRDIDPEDISLGEPVFIYFDGLPVPFFISSLTQRGNSRAIVHLNDVTSLEDAEELVGQSVWVDWEEEEGDEEGLGDLVGWTLAGAGRITGFLDIPANPCLEVETKNGTSVLVPFHEDLILSADPDARVLEMEIPDGLLDL
jgi:16S rRNA processing protein RimM